MRQLIAAGLLASLAVVAEAAPVVAVDVGHTQAASGATSARGGREFDFNLALAREVADALRQRGVDARLVNADGNIGSLVERTQAVPEAVFFLSIHHDSVSEEELHPWRVGARELSWNDDWSGHSLFISANNPQPAASLLCAQTMALRLQRAGFRPTVKNARQRAYADASLAVHYYDNLVVLYRNPVPAVLFEAGVIKHRAEELSLQDPRRRQRMAAELASGVVACVLAGGVGEALR